MSQAVIVSTTICVFVGVQLFSHKGTALLYQVLQSVQVSGPSGRETCLVRPLEVIFAAPPVKVNHRRVTGEYVKMFSIQGVHAYLCLSPGVLPTYVCHQEPLATRNVSHFVSALGRAYGAVIVLVYRAQQILVTGCVRKNWQF